MSIVINVENFQGWSEIFTEIERQRNLRIFTAIQPGNSNSHRHYGTKPRFSSMKVKGPAKRYEQACQTEMEVFGRKRLNSTPSPAISGKTVKFKLQRDSRLTAAAWSLSEQQLALLYEDILKPLDVYSILNERRKHITSCSEQDFPRSCRGHDDNMNY